MPLVLLVSYSGALGGAERLLVEFATALEGEICLACPPGRLADASRAAGLRVFPLRARTLHLRSGPAAAAAELLGHRREVRALARELHPSLVVAWSMRSALACLLPRVHDGPVLFQHNDFLPRSPVGALVRRVARRADRVLAPSHACAAELGLPPGHVIVVHPGLDPAEFTETPVSVDPPRVLVLGALVAWKRADLALEVASALRQRLPDLQLRLTGSALPDGTAGFEAALRRRAGQPDLDGIVEFRGEAGDARAELEWASCLLHCADREPFGIAVLEALAAGRPVVAPAAGGPVEIVSADCGELYPAGEPGAAAGALERILSDPGRAREMGAAGRRRVSTHFGRGTAREAYRRVVQGLAVVPAPAASAPLEIVTVTHDSAPELRALLASVERHLPGTRVTVVDAASADDSVKVAGQWRGRCQVVSVALGENPGFGRACNRGIAEVRAPVTALLNPDVELLDDSLARLAAAAHGARRLLAPAVLTTQGRRQDSVHPLPGGAAELLRALLPYTRLPLRSLAPWRSRRPRRVGWAVGCALVADTALLRELGPFDERIFLYAEDLDLGLHAAQAGVATWFHPEARVLHHGAHSTVGAFGGEAFERLAAMRHGVVARRRGPARAHIDDAAQALTFATRRLARVAIGQQADRERRQLRALRRRR